MTDDNEKPDASPLIQSAGSREFITIVEGALYRVGDIRVCNRRKSRGKDWWCVITNDPMQVPEVTHSKYESLGEAKDVAISIVNTEHRHADHETN